MKSKRQPWDNRQAKELPYPQPSLCGGSSIKPLASCHSTQLSGGRHQSRFLLLLSLLLALSVPFQPQALLLLPPRLFLDCLYISKIVDQGKTSGCRWHFLKLILNTLINTFVWDMKCQGLASHLKSRSGQCTKLSRWYKQSDRKWMQRLVIMLNNVLINFYSFNL